jgi:HD-GYP domain-containing protein (c-di-GMP phosphodiesterase class II)
VADVYDALRFRRQHKPVLSREAVVEIVTQGSHGQFDPRLIQVF